MTVVEESFVAFIPRERKDYARAGQFLFALAKEKGDELGLELVQDPSGLQSVQWMRKKPQTFRRLTRHTPTLFELDKMQLPHRGEKVGKVAVWVFGDVGMLHVVDQAMPRKLFDSPDELMGRIVSQNNLLFNASDAYNLPTGAARDYFVLEFASALKKD